MSLTVTTPIQERPPVIVGQVVISHPGPWPLTSLTQTHSRLNTRSHVTPACGQVVEGEYQIFIRVETE